MSNIDYTKNIALTVSETKLTEQAAISAGVSEDGLIERAAKCAYERFLEIAEQNHTTLPKDASIAVLAGGGNNGADALSFAMRAVTGGYNVTVYLIPARINDYCARRISKLNELNCKVTKINSTDDIAAADYYIDGIIGTGCSRGLGGLILSIVQKINKLSGIKIALDIPTGLNADTGRAMGDAIIADETVTFGFYKVGQIISDGRNYCGKISVCDIGLIPPSGKEGSQGSAARIISESDIALSPRKTVSHKGTYGNVKIIGGSPEMTGGALLSLEGATAALRSGAGYATLVVPESLAAVYQQRVREETLQILPDDNGKIIFDEAALSSVISRAKVVVIGMGLSCHGGLIEVIKYLASREITLILDAEALNALSKNLSAVKGHICKLILTPHAGEFRRLVSGRNYANDIEAVRDFARELSAVVVMKSATTIISDGNVVWLNTTGSPAMAKAGSGDVLSGIISGIAAYNEPLLSAMRGCYLFGKLGEKAASRYGETAVLASDIIKLLEVMSLPIG